MYAPKVFHKMGQESRGQQASRFVQLWKDRLTAAVGQPAFWALGKSGGQGSLEKGKRKEGKGLVLGKTKSDEVEAVNRVVVEAESCTLPSRSVEPRTGGQRCWKRAELPVPCIQFKGVEPTHFLEIDLHDLQGGLHHYRSMVVAS